MTTLIALVCVAVDIVGIVGIVALAFADTGRRADEERRRYLGTFNPSKPRDSRLEPPPLKDERPEG